MRSRAGGGQRAGSTPAEPGGAAASLLFGYGDLTVLVESATDRHLAWLREFLSPAFEIRADTPYACRVSLIEDDERYRATLSRGADGTIRDAFALDTEMIRLPRWRAPEGVTTLFDERHGVFYEIAPNGRAVSVLTLPGNLAARTRLMRVVREIAMNHAQCTGGLVLHASAYAAGGRGVLLVGPKAAGKTSALIHALGRGAMQYVSNDRVLAVFSGGGLAARALPTIVTIRPETVALFPWLSERLADSGYQPSLSLAEAALSRLPRPPRGADRPYALSPAQFCALVGAAAVQGCGVAAVVFPRVTGEPGCAGIREIGPEEAAVRLADALFAVRSSSPTSDLFRLPSDPPAPDAHERKGLTRRVAEAVPCFEGRLGPDAYETDVLFHALQSLATWR